MMHFFHVFPRKENLIVGCAFGKLHANDRFIESLGGHYKMNGSVSYDPSILTFIISGYGQKIKVGVL